MSGERVISVSHYIKWSEISDILQKGRFEYIPAITYIVQRDGSEKENPTIFYFDKPFSLWEQGMSIEILCKYAKDEIERKEELKIARRAYMRLKDFANRCAERVLADLICAMLLKTWDNSTDQFIYFIEGPPSNKILARFSYMYPSLKNLTICFISFKQVDLITSVMSFQAGRMEFDIHRLLLEEITDFLGPYPGTSEESLIQTYFYRHPEVRPGKKVSPIRIDIFTQGLLESDFEDKKKIIKEKLEDETWTGHYPVADLPVETILPKGLITVIDSWEKEYNYAKVLERVIRRI